MIPGVTGTGKCQSVQFMETLLYGHGVLLRAETKRDRDDHFTGAAGKAPNRVKCKCIPGWTQWAPLEKSGPFSRGGLHVEFINPFINLCQQRRILFPGGYPRAIPILFYYPVRPEWDIKNKSGADVSSFSSDILETSWCRSKDNPKVRWNSVPRGVQNPCHKSCFAPLQTAEVLVKKLNKIQV